ncbi:cytoplasmic protein [Heliocybe sulcata]|uniref:Cytoplasmic protein n=1 Tax=Heliocybe sulcata TaxID=5364 RepID=A0A5C3NDA2_9AGAM|nr:cytoplasmic protein [Heliocybe sulcata]
MRPQWYSVALLVPALAAVFTASSANAAPPTSLFAGSSDAADALVENYALIRRDDHAHGHDHHAAPKTQLNETEILMWHQPTPPSYYTHDFESNDPHHPGLMAMHILFMSLAFFGALPAGIALRSVNHAWHGFTVILFWTFTVLGLASNALYKKLTPDLYEGQKHSIQGYFWIFLALCITAVDILHLGLRAVTYVRSIRSGSDNFTFKKVWTFVVLGQEASSPIPGSEYDALTAEPEEIYDMHDMQKEVDDHDSDDAQEIEHIPRHQYTRSASSERTVFGFHSPPARHSDETLHEVVENAKEPWSRFLMRATFAVLERALVFGGFMQVLSGIVIYTGGCRESYVNNCLAHLIKGGIFWCYGLVTFARYLGSFSELGWAWNRAPRNEGKYPTAEFTESAVIFLYGITNTWMERFGANPGDPYSTKQVQHIGIAVMFWYAGLVGMGLESRRVRRWLAAASTAALHSGLASSGRGGKQSQEAVMEPPSYTASFNPFPAMVIGVTGLAMSAHFQTYLFQVQIHALWGGLLAGFSALRFLTYFFLWVSPPRSILPSRPPTEALASFFLACGGLVFMFSTEEVTLAAMRRGRDDMMMFLNVAVAITCFCFCWTMGVVAFKGWLKSRTYPGVKFHAAA